jgi:hypothetical protein
MTKMEHKKDFCAGPFVKSVYWCSKWELLFGAKNARQNMFSLPRFSSPFCDYHRWILELGEDPSDRRALTKSGALATTGVCVCQFSSSDENECAGITRVFSRLCV